MFSDKLRLLKISLAFVILALLVLYVVHYGPKVYPGYREAILEPEKYAGQKVYFSGDIVRILENSFTIRWDEKAVTVIGSIPKDKKNYHISGTAIFNEDQSLGLLNYHASRLIQYKIFLSIIPLLVVFYLFFKEYAFHLKKMMFERRI